MSSQLMILARHSTKNGKYLKIADFLNLNAAFTGCQRREDNQAIMKYPTKFSGTKQK